ncbi:MAG: hypothetical protein AAF081_14370 [Actinomycetota bacterium]
MSTTMTLLSAALELAQESGDADFYDDAGRIIGSPAAGPKPENPGDRGGYAQLLTAFMIFAGLSFIAFQIWRETAKARRAREG